MGELSSAAGREIFGIFELGTVALCFREMNLISGSKKLGEVGGESPREEAIVIRWAQEVCGKKSGSRQWEEKKSSLDTALK